MKHLNSCIWLSLKPYHDTDQWSSSSLSGVRCQLCDELVRVWMETQGGHWCVTSEELASGHDGAWRVPGVLVMMSLSLIHPASHKIQYTPGVTLFVGYDVVKVYKKCNTGCIFDEVSVGQWTSRGRCNAINRGQEWGVRLVTEKAESEWHDHGDTRHQYHRRVHNEEWTHSVTKVC